MASTKKKKITKPSKTKIRVRKPRKEKIEMHPESAAPALESSSRRSSSSPLFWILGLAALAALASYLWQRGPSTCSLPQKISAGAEIQPTPAPSTPAAEPTPEKRATSPDSPRVWDREKNASPVRFYILRDDEGHAAVTVFKAGNVLVKDIEAPAGKAGTVKLIWDGSDKDGEAVPNGTYYVRLSGAHGDMVEEILIK